MTTYDIRIEYNTESQFHPISVYVKRSNKTSQDVKDLVTEFHGKKIGPLMAKVAKWIEDVES